nr:mitogen-activated protein kinase kinase kinase A [Tanacetum cinerariifolium]
IPLCRINGDATPDVDCPFPSLSKCEKIKERGSTALMKCNLGSVEAAAKVRTLKVSGSSADEFRSFDYKSIGESGNVLIDINKDVDGATVVKLCDFDTAVPLRSSLHTCCIGHTGIPPPDASVGTVRWMAPEVYWTLHDRRVYGLEVDLWSFGCLILKLLTLQLPYAGLRESKIHELILLCKRPLLTDELEALGPVEDIQETESETNESGITKGARHFHAKVHYLREVIEFGDIKLEKVYTDDNLADPFTKALAFPKHSEHTKNIGMLSASSLM